MQLKELHEFTRKILTNADFLSQIDYLDYYNLQRFNTTLHKKLGTLSVIPDDHKYYSCSVDPNEYAMLHRITKKWNPTTEADSYLMVIFTCIMNDLHKQYQTRKHSVGYQLFPGTIKAEDGRTLYDETPYR